MNRFSYKKLCIQTSWAIFPVALLIYWLTCERGASFWDCPEYVTVASLLEVGHPPGNPFWSLAMRVATLPFPAHLHALVINMWSGIFMAGASLFLCRLAFVGLNYVFPKNIPGRSLAVALASAGASLCFAFCDSAWFSATEAEVYAMSTFLTGLTLWIMVLWTYETDSGKRKRWLILTAYLIGLSLGVHQLNLLCLPVFALMILYRRYPGRLSFIKVALTLLFSFAIVAVILFGFTQFTLQWLAMAELKAVNGLKMPYGSGIWIFCLSSAMFFLILLILCRHNSKISTMLWMCVFTALGFSSFGMILIRATAYPPMNEGVPDNVFALASYINRDQYGHTSLIYGPTPYSRAMLQEDFHPEENRPSYRRYILKTDKPRYAPMMPGARLHHRSGLLTQEDSMQNREKEETGEGYLLADYSFSQVKTPELNMWFPRITSSSPADIESYASWAGMTEKNMLKVKISETIDSLGKPQPLLDVTGQRVPKTSLRPTYGQNLQFFLTYQTGYMFLRYLLWNFLGRQNDYPSKGEIEHGNFITGVPFIDDAMLGPQNLLPPEAGNQNKGRTVYYGLPFIFGLVGIISLGVSNRKGRRVLLVSSLFFLMTSMAIVIYINQSPGEPRERDYTFIASYMGFAFWIAVGTMAILKRISYKIRNIKIFALAAIIISLASPTLMCFANYAGHDRTGRPDAGFFASHILDMERPAIIFSQGDNFTFPLWYAQEILNHGKEHTVIDVTYLSLPDYVVNLMKQGQKGLKMIARPSDILYGAYAMTKIPSDTLLPTLPLREALEKLYSQKENEPVFPTTKVILPGPDSITLHLKEFTGGSSYLPFRQLMLLDIIAANADQSSPRPLYFLHSVSGSLLGSLKQYVKQGPYARVFENEKQDHGLETDDDYIFAETMLSDIQPSLRDSLKRIRETAWLDAVLNDQIRRERGGWILTANALLHKGRTSEAAAIASKIPVRWSYELTPPGTYTLSDSTFHEGMAFARILIALYDSTGNESWKELANQHLLLMRKQADGWTRYYLALPEERRDALSNETLRIISKSGEVRALQEIIN